MLAVSFWWGVNFFDVEVRGWLPSLSVLCTMQCKGTEGRADLVELFELKSTGQGVGNAYVLMSSTMTLWVHVLGASSRCARVTHFSAKTLQGIAACERHSPAMLPL